MIYLTPFFPATSTHRYDATTFDHVDPLLGGDETLRSLARAAHERGIRLLGDITLNHTGYRHEWFERARADAHAPERDFYYFDDSIPGGYESWLGHRTLPKLNWQSDELHARFSQVLRRYLELGLDGWRIDVANMVGRYRDLDLNRDVAKWTREQVGDALLVAEHGHDFRPDFAVRGWHGVMNYSGFMRPLWTWLLRDDPEPSRSATSGASRSASRSSTAGPQSRRCAGSAPACRGSRFCTRGTCSTATTSRASARSPAPPSATSSGSGCR